jgi:hypothetical protein
MFLPCEESYWCCVFSNRLHESVVVCTECFLNPHRLEQRLTPICRAYDQRFAVSLTIWR